jgi:hypothetical protein
LSGRIDAFREAPGTSPRSPHPRRGSRLVGSARRRQASHGEIAVRLRAPADVLNRAPSMSAARSISWDDPSGMGQVPPPK